MEIEKGAASTAPRVGRSKDGSKILENNRLPC